MKQKSVTDRDPRVARTEGEEISCPRRRTIFLRVGEISNKSNKLSRVVVRRGREGAALRGETSGIINVSEVRRRRVTREGEGGELRVDDTALENKFSRARSRKPDGNCVWKARRVASPLLFFSGYRFPFLLPASPYLPLFSLASPCSLPSSSDIYPPASLARPRE